MKSPLLLSEHIENGTLKFDAFSDNIRWNTFGLYIATLEVPVALIRSIGVNKIRIFRGYGKKIADQRLGHKGRVLWNFDGTNQIMIIKLQPESGEALDITLFEGEITRGMDAEIYGFLMETIEVRAINFIT